MALLERVTTLIRANLNDLIERAENPEKLLKQLLLDMQNQFMQVKTQVAMAIADQHLLEKKQKESLTSQREWLRKAELSLVKQEEGLTRTALERSLAYETAAVNFAQQVEEQSHQVQLLRDAMQRLEQKITETKIKADLLVGTGSPDPPAQAHRYQRIRRCNQRRPAAAQPAPQIGLISSRPRPIRTRPGDESNTHASNTHAQAAPWVNPRRPCETSHVGDRGGLKCS